MKNYLWTRAAIQFLSLFGFSMVMGAVPPPQKILKGEGSLIGGIAGTGFSLLDIRPSRDQKKKAERIVIDVGDMNGAPIKGLPGYYHAQLLKNPARLSIDFSQMPISKLQPNVIKQRLTKSSIFIQDTKISLDPVDQSLNLTIYFQRDPSVKVYQVPSQKTTSKVVVDLF